MCVSKIIRRRDIPLREQTIRLASLSTTVQSLLKISSVSGVDLLLLGDRQDVVINQAHVDKMFVVLQSSVIEYIEDFTVQYANDLNELNNATQNSVIKTVLKALLESYIKLLQLQVNRHARNAPAESTLHPLLHYHLHIYLSTACFKIVELQKDLISVTDSMSIRTLEREFKDFKHAATYQQYVLKSPQSGAIVPRPFRTEEIQFDQWENWISAAQKGLSTIEEQVQKFNGVLWWS